MSVEELIVHAGLPKTGTTALQYTLGLSRRDLSGGGYLLPPYFWGEQNHKLIALSCRTYENFLKTAAANPAGRQLRFNRVRRNVEWGRFYLALKTFRSRYRKVILTAESFSALRSEDELKSLKKTLSVVPYRSLRLVVYVRSPVNHYTSQVLQAAKSRGRTDALSKFDRIQKVLDFLDLWERILGGSIELHLYQRDFDPDWDISTDFSAKVLDGFSLRANSVPVNRRNPSVSAEGASLIVEFRRKWFPELPAHLKPLEVHRFAQRVGQEERQIAREVEPRLRPEVKQRILLSARSPLETMIHRFGLVDDRGVLTADYQDGVPGVAHATPMCCDDIDDVFELDYDYRNHLTERLTAHH